MPRKRRLPRTLPPATSYRLGIFVPNGWGDRLVSCVVMAGTNGGLGDLNNGRG